MKVYGLGLGLLAAVFVAAIGAHLMLGARFAPGLTPLGSFMNAFMIPKTVIILCALMTLGAGLVARMGAADLARPEGPAGREAEKTLRSLAGVAVGLGGLGGLYGELMTRKAIEAVGGTVSFAVTAPSRMESLLVVAVGALAAFLILSGAAFLYAKWRRGAA